MYCLFILSNYLRLLLASMLIFLQNLLCFQRNIRRSNRELFAFTDEIFCKKLSLLVLLADIHVPQLLERVVIGGRVICSWQCVARAVLLHGGSRVALLA